MAGHPRKRQATNAPFRTVLVATDFSQHSEWAVERAARLPIATGGKLIIAHALSERIPTRYRGRITRDIHHSLQVLSHHVISRYRKAGRADVSVIPMIVTGAPYVEIIRLARTEAVDVIVLGKHGRRAIRDLLLGSTAERIVRNADRPVLSVNLRPFGPYDKPVVAVDLEDTACSTIGWALRTVGSEIDQITIIHAHAPPFEGVFMASLSQQELKTYRDECRTEAIAGIRRLLRSCRNKMSWRIVVKSGDPRTVLLREVSARRADLIILGTHGRSGLSHALLGSVAEHVVRASACDVLVCPPIRLSFKLP